MLTDRRARRRRAVPTLLFLVLLSLAGCADNKLYVSSTTVLGLNASVNTARNAGHVQFGYDRYFITWVPQSVETAVPVGSSEEPAKEVMSALNCTEVTVGFLSLKKFEESLATGAAAHLFAQNIGAKEYSYFECFQPGSGAAAGGTAGGGAG